MAEAAGSEADDAAPGTAAGIKQSYRQILTSTALIGGSSLVNIAFSIVRSKAMALLLGPSGVGLIGLYSSIADLTQTVAGFGVQTSGVRQIAEAAASGDEDDVARIAVVLRRVSLALGLVGAFALVVLCVPIARLSFGDGTHAIGVALLAAAVLFKLVSGGQIALVQGLRRIGDLARINMLSAFFSAVISVLLVWLLGTRGIVPALVAIAAASILTSWWYRRKVQLPAVRISGGELRREARALLSLGAVFMWSTLFLVAAAYIIRIIIVRNAGFEAAGFYQAAWTLGGLYAGFLLQAMGTDLLPRLTGVADDHLVCNRLANEQAEVSILLAGPGALATLTLAPLVISFFYTPEFHAAIGVLRWISLGTMLQIIAWPIGFIIIAKGARGALFFAEAAAFIVQVGLAWLLVPIFGAAGAGMAFLCLYIWHSVLVYVLAWRLTGFRFSRETATYGAGFVLASSLVLAAFHVLPGWQATSFGLLLTGASGLLALRRLLDLLPDETFPEPLKRVLARLRRQPSV
ncbi:MAG: O-antigen translocase [Pararhizobium sp.]